MSTRTLYRSNGFRAYSVLLFSLLPFLSESFQQLPGNPRALGIVQIETYPIRVSRCRDIKRAYRIQGIYDTESAVRRLARTQWKFAWQWQNAHEGIVTGVQTTLDAKMLLPRVLGMRDPRERAEWRQIRLAIVEHELRHLSYAVGGALKLQARIGDASRSGILPENRARRIAGDVVAEMRSADQRYDYATIHGRSEGIP